MALNRRFRLIAQDFIPATATTAQFNDIADDVNINATKVLGRRVFNTTTSKPVYATGDTAGAVWNDAVGVLAHTPV